MAAEGTNNTEPNASLESVEEIDTNAANVSEDGALPPEVILEQARQFKELAKKWAVNPENLVVEGEDLYSAFHYSLKSQSIFNSILYIRNLLNEQLAALQLQVEQISGSVIQAAEWAANPTNSPVEVGKYSARHYATIAANTFASLTVLSTQLESLVNGNIAQATTISNQLLAVNLPALNASIASAQSAIVTAQEILNSIIGFNNTAEAAATAAVTARDDALDAVANLTAIAANAVNYSSGLNFIGRSTDTIALGLGVIQVTLTPATRVGFAPAAYLAMTNVNDALYSQSGIMQDWDVVTGVLTINIQSFQGTGTVSNWIISPAIQPPQTTGVIISDGTF